MVNWLALKKKYIGRDIFENSFVFIYKNILEWFYCLSVYRSGERQITPIQLRLSKKKHNFL